jgi:outer membrane protein OmpA-like peptidoglycan-associated protein
MPRRALALGLQDLHRCKGHHYAATLARWAQEVKAWDQAVNLWGIASQRSETKEKQSEYKEEQNSATKKFLRKAKHKLRHRQKKEYWNPKLRGGRGGLEEVEEGPSLDVRILFATNRWKIEAGGRALLDTMVKALEPLLKEGKKIKIVGHADKRGPESWNKELSRKRAESVLAYLRNKGLRVQQIKVFGEGSRRPLTSNRTPEGQAKNRRVEFAVLE